MPTPITIAEKYFELSNQGDLPHIADMFTLESTYSSVNTGEYHGGDEIMEMMKSFHDSFTHLSWTIKSSKEVQAGVVEIAFVMHGIKLDGETVEREGTENITVRDGKLLRVEVKSFTL